MGGAGSGNFRGAKRTVQDCHTLACSWLLKNHFFDVDVKLKKERSTLSWSDNGNGFYYTHLDLQRTSLIEMRLFLYTSGQLVYLIATPMHFGGLRWWFKCPQCFRRCAKLHLDEDRNKFYCRKCLDLTYKSCLESHTFDSVFSEIAPRMGKTKLEVAQMFSRAKRGHKEQWIRKRDRRPDYKSRGICPMYPDCNHD